jgi:hypothetical protein
MALAAGCSDRGTNPDRAPAPTSGVEPPTEVDHVMFDELLLQLGNVTNQLAYSAYWPDTSYFLSNDGPQIPILILLPPHGGSQYFYLHHGLVGIADRLLADGLIDPMVIVMIDNRSAFGGHFYAGNKSNGAGKWDKIIGQTLIDHFENIYERKIFEGNPNKRGIGGIGQGAYGAYRAAILNDSAYGSVSGAHGPMDFDGPNGDGGLISLMDSVLLSEQPELTAENVRNLPPTGFDTLQAYPISRMFAGGAMAFSPMFFNLDSLISYRVRADSTEVYDLQLDDQLRFSPGHAMIESDGDTLYPSFLIDSVVTQADFNLEFYLPFGWDESGVLHVPYDPIWSMWMDDNLDSLLINRGSLEGVDCWLANSPQAKWNHYEMTESWISFLQSRGLSPTVHRYSGYDGFPADDNEYVYDLLEKMLIFHSESFKE